MRRKRFVMGGVWLAAIACNAAPPVPENPRPPGAPDLGPLTTQSTAPPPISGGTLIVSRDGTTAIAADSDRDFVSFVDLGAGTVRARADLMPGDEPGRLAEDSGGNVYVALRGTGELATVSVATGQVLGRRPVCAQPRGVAYDSLNDQIVVACATGELVTLPTGSGPAVQTLTIEPDLRDVVIDGNSIFVSKFRTAEVLSLTRDGVISQRVTLPSGSPRTAAQAWRMRGTPNHELVISYQADSTAFVPTTPGGYGGASSSLRGAPPGVSAGTGGGGTGGGSAGGPLGNAIVDSVVVTLSTPAMTMGQRTFLANPMVLPVDIAIPPVTANSSNTAALVAAGNWKSPVTVPYTGVAFRAGVPVSFGRSVPLDGQLVAADFSPDGTLVLQSREPAQLYVVQRNAGNPADKLLATIPLSDVSREDTGHTIFHTNSGGSIACASCHGEGGEDAQTWNFDGTKPRRTPSLLGTVKGTAPYHWDADFPDLQALTHEVYTRRMGGILLSSDQVTALRGWVERLPAPKRPSVDPAASARGQALFEGKGACSGCHSGPSYTNNATVDVGTGGALQVPPLVGVGARAPFLHSGCAQTLTERFTKCATAGHGQTAALSDAEVADMVTFLNSL